MIGQQTFDPTCLFIKHYCVTLLTIQTQMPNINRTNPMLPWKVSTPKSNKSWGNNTGFYSKKAWRSLRKIKLMEDPLCVNCKTKGSLTSAAVVDHIIPRRLRPDLELNWANLQSLCESCHNSKSGTEGRGGRNPKNQNQPNR